MDKTLRGSLPIVAGAYGDSFGVRVVCSGSSAFTDGTVITIPFLDEVKGEDLYVLVYGYLIHESAHIRSTDFGVFNSIADGVTRGLTNILEDPRIETAMVAEFPGTARKLRGLWAHVAGKYESPSDDLNEAGRLLNFVLASVRQRQWELVESQPMYDDCLRMAQEVFPAGFFVRFDGLLNLYFDDMQNTLDALRLAQAILKVLQEEIENEQPPLPPCGEGEDDEGDEPGEGQGNSQSDTDGEEPGDSTGDGSGSPDLESEADADGEGGSNGGDSADQEDGESNSQSNTDSDGDDSNSGQQEQPGNQQKDDEQSSDEAPSSNPGGSGASAHERIQQILSETDLPEDVMQQVADELSSQAAEEQNGDERFMHSDLSAGKQISGSDWGMGSEESLNRGLVASTKLRAQITALLQAETKAVRSLREEGRRIESRRLGRAMAGDRNIFRHKEKGKRIDTSVHILLDASGSMSGDQGTANAACVSLALAIASIPQADVAVSVFGFRDSVNPILRRGQSVRPNLKRFAVHACGGTPMGQAMMYGLRELATESRRERKVMVVITDGAPNDGEVVQYVNRLCDRANVDVYAIGIRSYAVQRYFKNAEVIQQVEDLNGSLFALAKQFLKAS